MHRLLAHLTKHPHTILVAYLVLYGLFGIATVSFYPSYSYPGGDEATYLSWAQSPWTLISEAFEGYPPMEITNPYTLRLFLGPFSLVFAVFGFTYMGARLLVFAYGLGMLILVYDLGRCLGSRVGGLIAAVLLSLSPVFLFLTHGVRAEGMFTLFVLLCLWMILRCGRGPGVKTYALLAFVSGSMIMIHLNGVAMPVVFFVVVLVRDWPNISGRKILAFLIGGMAIVVLYLLVNFLPAIDALQQYGPLPLTYLAKNQIAIVENPNPWGVLVTGINGYLKLINRGIALYEPWTTPFLRLFLPMALIALLYRSNRATWCVAVTLVLLVVMLLMVIPNQRWTYMFYLIPPLFILALQGAVRLPRPWVAGAVTAALTLTVAIAYLVADVNTLHTAWHHHRNNRVTEAQIRKLITDLGRPGDVTVMAGGEFHAVVHDTRYRSFHSLLETEDIEESLKLLRPDIVVLHLRVDYLIGRWSLERRGGIPRGKDYQRLRNRIDQAMIRQNYRSYAAPSRLTWDGKKVRIFYKSSGQVQAGSRVSY